MPNLSRIRVIDLSRLLPGPYCTLLLADMGADVIKIETTLMGDPVRITPPHTNDESVTFAAINRNKRSLAVNYRKPAGQELLHALLKTGDVLVETFKPGQAARYGLDYESVRAVNPQIVYCSLSGYGQSGDYAHRSGHDINFLALAGVLDLLRDAAGRPVLPAFQLADLAGAWAATTAILAALVERSQTGQGQFLDASIFEGAASLLSVQVAPILTSVELHEPPHVYLAGELPSYNIYETADGRYMALGALEPVLWAEFCRAVGREDLIGRHLPPQGARQPVIDEVAAIFKQRTQAQWEAFLADKDLCCEPVLRLEELEQRAYGRAGGRVLAPARPEQPPVRQLASPRALQDEDAPIRPAPLLGQHTAEIMAELGYTAEQIEALRSKKVVATSDDVTVRIYRGAEGLVGKGSG